MLEIMPLISSYPTLYPMKAKSILVVEDDAGWRERVCNPQIRVRLMSIRVVWVYISLACFIFVAAMVRYCR